MPADSSVILLQSRLRVRKRRTSRLRSRHLLASGKRCRDPDTFSDLTFSDPALSVRVAASIRHAACAGRLESVAVPFQLVEETSGLTTHPVGPRLISLVEQILSLGQCQD